MNMQDVITEIDRRIREYENIAEECFQELEDTERGDEYLSNICELQSLKSFILGE